MQTEGTEGRLSCVLNVIKMRQIRIRPERGQLKVKEAICVIQRGAEPSLEICKSRFLRDTTFHHGGATCDCDLWENAESLPIYQPERGSLSVGYHCQSRTPALWSHTGGASPLNTNETGLGEERGDGRSGRPKLFISEDASSAGGVLTASCVAVGAGRKWPEDQRSVAASFLQTPPPGFAFLHGCVSATADSEHRSL